MMKNTIIFIVYEHKGRWWDIDMLLSWWDIDILLSELYYKEFDMYYDNTMGELYDTRNLPITTNVQSSHELFNTNSSVVTIYKEV